MTSLAGRPHRRGPARGPSLPRPPRHLRGRGARQLAVRGAPVHGDPDTAVEPPEIADNAAARARPYSSLMVSSTQGTKRPEASAEVPTSQPDMTVPAEDTSHGTAVGQFRVFKPPAGVSTWDSSPFVESPFTEAPAQARRDGVPLPDGAGHGPRKPRLAAQPWPLLAVLLV